MLDTDVSKAVAPPALAKDMISRHARAVEFYSINGRRISPSTAIKGRKFNSGFLRGIYLIVSRESSDNISIKKSIMLFP
jgi:hypothetical protein